MDFFTIYLPIAGIHFNVLLLLLIGFTVGVCGGFFGIGGAWIVTPALNIFGFPMPYAIGTDLAHMGGKSIVSTMRHGKFGNVDVRLGVLDDLRHHHRHGARRPARHDARARRARRVGASARRTSSSSR